MNELAHVWGQGSKKIEKAQYTQVKTEVTHLAKLEHEGRIEDLLMVLISGILHMIMGIVASYILWTRNFANRCKKELKKQKMSSSTKTKELYIARARTIVLQSSQIHRPLSSGRKNKAVQKMIRRNAAQSFNLHEGSLTAKLLIDYRSERIQVFRRQRIRSMDFFQLESRRIFDHFYALQRFKGILILPSLGFLFFNVQWLQEI